MEIIYIIFTSLGSILTLLILTRLMGYRQISQLSMFDYVSGITIGSIAAEMATSLESDFVKPLTAMVVYSLVVISISFIDMKWIKMRRIINGTPIILLNNDKLYYKNLQHAKIDLGEFLIRCRNSGYFDLSKIQTAVMESNGKISFLPKEKERPVTPKDLELNPNKDTMVSSIIMDGQILKENLRQCGKDEKWLKHGLKAYGVNDISEVFFATCDNQNKLNVYMKIKEKIDIGIFE